MRNWPTDKAYVVFGLKEPCHEGERTHPLTPAAAALLSSTERIALAAKALADIGANAGNMEPDILAEEIDRRTGVGFEASAVVTFSLRQSERRSK